ncbi:hypothetical protein [Belnapia rosea]|uniref:Uncharacterized protein n=1 Tax=Belnapia rosea TaxID=938405 RepID=A0A1G6KK31_9PROT|nr:hypothetical protein [Belnapia rosea]SDB19148.1 hypothetical protein SAMN02927895_00737 [Belnapia rosea]SDC31323.1 hypothetical protein SAMN04487779_1001547 [Belnapia rosea]
MSKTRRLAALLGFALIAAPAFAFAQSAPMQPGQRMPLGPMMGERVLRQVMVNDDSSVTLVYDMKPGLPQSQRVLRLENVNGMLEVVYDTAAPGMRVGNDGAVPRLTVGSGNMIEVQYDRK